MTLKVHLSKSNDNIIRRVTRGFVSIVAINYHTPDWDMSFSTISG